jgi:hypothetical protein
MVRPSTPRISRMIWLFGFAALKKFISSSPSRLILSRCYTFWSLLRRNSVPCLDASSGLPERRQQIYHRRFLWPLDVDPPRLEPAPPVPLRHEMLAEPSYMEACCTYRLQCFSPLSCLLFVVLLQRPLLDSCHRHIEVVCRLRGL